MPIRFTVKVASSRRLVCLLIAAGCLALTGCSVGSSSESKDGRKVVLTSFTVIADMAQNVAGDKLTVRSITKPGAEVHHYEPTPKDIARAQDADLILNNGFNLELWFKKFLDQTDGTPSVTLTEGIKPLPIGEGDYVGKPNPHSWMSPANALIYVENIRKAFVEIDPENAATYNANAAAYSAKLEKIGRRLEQSLSRIPQQQRWLITCEGAFSYLARDYGLKEGYIWSVNQEQQGSPQQVKRLIDTVNRSEIPALFCESTVSDKPQQRVAAATGAKLAGTLYVDSLSEKDGPVPTYLELLNHDVETVIAGLAGDSQGE